MSTWQAIRATQAEQHAQSELEQKKQQYERAEANYLKTLEAVDQLLTEVGEKELASMPHLEHVRRRLLGKALQFFEEFLQAKGTDPTVRFEAGLAYRRVGDIRGLLGEHQQAEQAYGQAVGLLDQLRAEAPAKRVYRQELARAYRGRAVVLAALGRREAAAKANETAVKLQEELVAEDPDHPDYRNDLAEQPELPGRSISELPAGSKRRRVLCARASRSWRRWSPATPTKRSITRLWPIVRFTLRRALKDAGKLEEEGKAHRRTADTVARAMKQFPGDHRFRQRELAVLITYGDFLERTGRISGRNEVLARRAEGRAETGG